MADATAKAALESVRRAAPTTSCDNHLTRAMAWHKWVLSYAAAWGDKIDMESVSAEEARSATADTATSSTSRSRTTMSHELWTDRISITCRRCGRSAPRGAPHKPLLLEPCRGSAAGRAAALHTGNRNYVWYIFSLAKRALVEKGGTLTARSTVPTELLDPDRIGELQADISGFSMDLAPSPTPCPPPPPSPTASDTIGPARPPPSRHAGEPGSPCGQRARPLGPFAAHGELHPHARPLPPPPSTARRRPRSADLASDDTALATQGQHRGEQSSTRRRTDATPRTSLHTPARPHPDGGHSPPPPASRRRLADAIPPSAHNVVITGPIAWCTRCARYAHQRAGRGLTTQCNPLAGGATPRRLTLLAQGRHPITGFPLT